MTLSPCSHFAEVSLGLEGVAGQRGEHGAREEQGLQHGGVLVEGHCREKEGGVTAGGCRQARRWETDGVLKSLLTSGGHGNGLQQRLQTNMFFKKPTSSQPDDCTAAPPESVRAAC